MTKVKKVAENIEKIHCLGKTRPPRQSRNICAVSIATEQHA